MPLEQIPKGKYDGYHEPRLELAERLLLEKAQNGELWAIQNILLLTSRALKDEARLTPGISQFIAKALEKIHGGEKADLAFGISRKRGQKDTRRARQRSFLMADFIERYRLHDKATLESAVLIASERFNVSQDTAKKAWKDNYKEVRRLINLELENFGKVRPHGPIR